MLRKLLLATALTLPMMTGAYAACAFKNDVPIKTLSASFPAWKAVTTAMAECGNVQSELDLQFKDKISAAMSAKPALYQVAGIAINSIVPLLNEGSLRPLDEYVAKYGQGLSPNQLIKVDGKIMAIAMMVNVQNFMYREDILAELNIKVPTTYDEVLAAAEAIKKSGKVPYPIGATWKAGWDLATDFVNLHLSYGGTFIGANNAASVNNEAGRKTLAMMKALSAYMDPEFLTSDAPFVQKQFQQGKIAISNLWVTRAGPVNDKAESTVAGKVKMAAAPAAMAGAKPATTLWWDGFAIAKNTSDKEAEAAFRVAMEGIDEEMVTANNDLAIWLVKGYKPGPLAAGASASAEGGAPTYPASSAMGLMHSALGDKPGFLNGSKTAEQTLADIEQAYTAAAKERGLIK